MSVVANLVLDFGGRRRITNLGQAQADGEPVTFEQLNAAIGALNWKDNVRVASTANINLASPGATIDGVTMASGDRFLPKNQTVQSENGIYIWNGAGVPATRALDANTFTNLESAVVRVDEGTSNANTRWRQTQVNGVIGTNNIVFVDDGSSAPAASETTAGVTEYATQAEADAGTADNLAITPLKLATSPFAARRFNTTIGDGSLTSIVVTHNLGTEDVDVYVRETGGLKREVLCEKQHTSINSVTLVFDVAPALNSLRVRVDR